MQIPDANSNYFILADASYCHILSENIVLTPNVNYKSLPMEDDRINQAGLILASLGVAFGCFLMVEFFIVGFGLMAFLFFIAMLAATKGVAEMARYSVTKNIPRKAIEEIKLVKPLFGYHSLIIRFKNKKGGSSLKKIKLYDSRQNEENAMALLRSEGLL